MTSETIRVSKRFSKLLKNGHKKTNSALNKNMKREMTFTDFTDFLAEFMERDIDVIIAKGIVLQPVKRGAKSNRVKFHMREFNDELWR